MMKFDSYFFKWVVSILAQADVFSKLATENRGDMKKIKNKIFGVVSFCIVALCAAVSCCCAEFQRNLCARVPRPTGRLHQGLHQQEERAEEGRGCAGCLQQSSNRCRRLHRLSTKGLPGPERAGQERPEKLAWLLRQGINKKQKPLASMFSMLVNGRSDWQISRRNLSWAKFAEYGKIDHSCR